MVGLRGKKADSADRCWLALAASGKECRHATLGLDLPRDCNNRWCLRNVGTGRRCNASRPTPLLCFPRSICGVAHPGASSPASWIGALHESACESWHDPVGGVAHTVRASDGSVPWISFCPQRRPAGGTCDCCGCPALIAAKLNRLRHRLRLHKLHCSLSASSRPR